MNDSVDPADARRAERAAAAMLENDAASRWFGIRLLDVAPGRARCTLTVAAQHANGHGICHGGVIFALADTAFAVACNSYNQNAVAQHNSITYLQPGRVGDTLQATAEEIHRQGRSGTYDITVVNGQEEVIALFRGHCRTIRGQLFEDDTVTHA